MSLSIGTLIATIGGDITPLKGSLAQANAALNKFSDQAEKNAEALKQQFRGLSTIGNSMKDIGGKMTLGLTLPLAAAGAASFKLASDLEENLNKTRVAFRGSGEEVIAWSENTLKSFGIAQSSALDMASLFGDMSTSMGLTGPEAAKMSTSLVGLAGDLASFKNINTDMASGALKGIFTGETEALKGLGIVMTEENLKQFAMSQGIKENIKDMTQAEKVQLRYAYVMANTTNAQGDFIRTGGGAANQMRIFGESLKQIGAQFGTIILPAITSVITSLNSLMTWISSLTETQKKWVIGIGAVLAAIGPLTFGLGFIIANIIPKLIMGFKAIGTAMSFLAANPIVLIVAAIAGLSILIVSLWKNCETFRAVVKYVAQNVAVFFQQAWIRIKEGAELMWLAIKTYFTAIPKLAAAVWEIIKRVMKGENIGEVIKEEFSKAFEDVGNEAQAIKDKYNAQLAEIKPVSWQEILDKEKAVSVAKETGEATRKQLENSFTATSTGTGIGTGTGKKSAPRENIQAMTSKSITPLSGGLNLGIADAVGLETEKLRAKSAELVSVANTMKSELTGVVVNMGQIIADSLGQAFTAVGEGLGKMLAGTADAGDLFKSILGVVADFMNSLGQALIAAGLASKAFTKLISNPALAIGAGIALIALAGFVKAKLSAGPAGGGENEGSSISAGKLSSVPAYASGGIVSGNSFSGDSVLSRLNSGEMVLNQSQQRNLFNKLDSSSGNSGYPSEILLRVQNGELQAVLQLIEKRDRNLR